jgi:uncharacterized protein (TIGR00106 family)
MLLIELSMSPMGAGESVSADVARAVDIIARSGLPYKLGPMGTCIEGQYDAVMDVVKHCLDDMRARNARVVFSIKADYREGAAGRLVSKVAAVEEKAGRKLST